MLKTDPLWHFFLKDLFQQLQGLVETFEEGLPVMSSQSLKKKKKKKKSKRADYNKQTYIVTSDCDEQQSSKNW